MIWICLLCSIYLQKKQLVLCTCFWHPSIFPCRFMQGRNIKSPYLAVFFRAGRLDPILIRHRFRKVLFFPVHTETRKRRFQKIPLWRALSKSCVFGERCHRIRVDGSRIRNDKVAFSIENEYAWTGHQLVRALLYRYRRGHGLESLQAFFLFFFFRSLFCRLLLKVEYI